MSIWIYCIAILGGMITLSGIIWRLDCRYNGNCTVLDFLKLRINRKKIVLWIGLALLAAGVLVISDYRGNNLISCFRNYAVLLWLIPIAYIDYKEQIIPNKFIGIGIVYWIVLFLLDVFVSHSNWMRVLQFSGIGLLLGSGIFLVGKLFVRNGIGMGDVKLYGVLGMLYGYRDLYNMLFITLIILFVTGVILLIKKKGNRKIALPMAPYTLAGFLCAIALGL